MRKTTTPGNTASGPSRLTSKFIAADAIKNLSYLDIAFSLYDNELAYIDKLLSVDVRNNSAWNQRFFVLKHLGLTPEIIQREVHYAMNRIRLIKNNESSWNFLKGLLEHGDHSTANFPDVETFVEDLYNTGNRSPYLLAFLVDIYSEKTMRIYENNSYDDPEISARKVYELCDMLANHYDSIRYKYWKYVQQKFRDEKDRAKLGPSSNETYSAEVPINVNGSSS